MDHKSIKNSQISFFNEEGYLKVENLLTEKEIGYYSNIYYQFLDNSIDTLRFRSDLSGSENESIEKITQIMFPSRLHPELLNRSLHQKISKMAKQLMGNDMALDFDMLINKAPHTNTITPWHQDEAYWIDMPDKRAVSCWVAIDQSSIDNGAMWYTPKSHKKPLLPHRQTGNKGALECDGSEDGSVCVELKLGSCVFHHGATQHYSRGNSSSNDRRAFILNFRPEKMIEMEREMGVDHSGDRELNKGRL